MYHKKQYTPQPKYKKKVFNCFHNAKIAIKKNTSQENLNNSQNYE